MVFKVVCSKCSLPIQKQGKADTSYPQQLPVTAHKEADKVLAVTSFCYCHIAAILGESYSCQGQKAKSESKAE